MKKIVKVILLITMCTSIFIGCTSTQGNSDEEVVYNYEDVKDTLIRFHVIANSDEDIDQELKLKVRDGVIEHLYPYLKESKSLEESREILKQNDDEVRKIAEQIIKENGFSYEINTELSRENFPDKTYGNITLPQGNYEAYRILIGEASGQNWWCVMFPPLCFIDVTKGDVSEQETKEKMDEQIQKVDSKEASKIDKKVEADKKIEDDKKNKEESEKTESPKVKFKIVEFFKGLFD